MDAWSDSWLKSEHSDNCLDIPSTFKKKKDELVLSVQ